MTTYRYFSIVTELRIGKDSDTYATATEGIKSISWTETDPWVETVIPKAMSRVYQHMKPRDVTGIIRMAEAQAVKTLFYDTDVTSTEDQKAVGIKSYKIGYAAIRIKASIKEDDDEKTGISQYTFVNMRITDIGPSIDENGDWITEIHFKADYVARADPT